MVTMTLCEFYRNKKEKVDPQRHSSNLFRYSNITEKYVLIFTFVNDMYTVSYFFYVPPRPDFRLLYSTKILGVS